MSKKDLKKIDESSPWAENTERIQGREAIMELHNGNVHPLIWWHGRLIHLRDSPRLLTKKHYNKHTGKYSQASEWTLLRKHLERELAELDGEYQRIMRRKQRMKKSDKKD